MNFIIQVNIDLEQEEPAFCNYLIRDKVMYTLQENKMQMFHTWTLEKHLTNVTYWHSEWYLAPFEYLPTQLVLDRSSWLGAFF